MHLSQGQLSAGEATVVPTLRLASERQPLRVRLCLPETRFGRQRGAVDVYLDSQWERKSISRQHAVIRRTRKVGAAGFEYSISATGQTGVLVNGVRITEAALQDGDEVVFGGHLSTRVGERADVAPNELVFLFRSRTATASLLPRGPTCSAYVPKLNLLAGHSAPAPFCGYSFPWPKHSQDDLQAQQADPQATEPPASPDSSLQRVHSLAVGIGRRGTGYCWNDTFQAAQDLLVAGQSQQAVQPPPRPIQAKRRRKERATSEDARAWDRDVSVGGRLGDISVLSQAEERVWLHHHMMHRLSSEFLALASLYGQSLITEMFLPPAQRTLRARHLGGVAGGSKFVVQGLLFKLAQDPKLPGGKHLYGGDRGANFEFAAKAAGHELKGANNYSQMPGLCVPLQTLVDYCGFRCVAMPVLPLGRGLIYGSEDGGKTVHASNPDFNRSMQHAAKELHLAEHRVGARGTVLHAAGDVEGHLGTDGRFYLLDLARAFPPEAGSATPHLVRHSQSSMFRMLRPEFLRLLKEQGRAPLSPDALTRWGHTPVDPQQAAWHDKNVRLATRLLVQEHIPAFARIKCDCTDDARPGELLSQAAYVGSRRPPARGLEAREDMYLPSLPPPQAINLEGDEGAGGVGDGLSGLGAEVWEDSSAMELEEGLEWELGAGQAAHEAGEASACALLEDLDMSFVSSITADSPLEAPGLLPCSTSQHSQDQLPHHRRAAHADSSDGSSRSQHTQEPVQGTFDPALELAQDPVQARHLRLAEDLHQHGINLRHLGLVRREVLAMQRQRRCRPGLAEAVGDLLLVEMVGRALKNLLRGELRDALGQVSSPVPSSVRTRLAAASFLNQVTCAASPVAEQAGVAGRATPFFWRVTVAEAVRQRFGADALQRAGDECASDEAGRLEEADALFALLAPRHLPRLLLYFTRMTGLHIRPLTRARFLQRPQAFRFLELDLQIQPRLKQMSLIPHAEGMVLQAEASGWERAEQAGAGDSRLLGRLLARSAELLDTARHADPLKEHYKQEARDARARYSQVQVEVKEGKTQRLPDVQQLARTARRSSRSAQLADFAQLDKQRQATHHRLQHAACKSASPSNLASSASPSTSHTDPDSPLISLPAFASLELPAPIAHGQTLRWRRSFSKLAAPRLDVKQGGGAASRGHIKERSQGQVGDAQRRGQAVERPLAGQMPSGPHGCGTAGRGGESRTSQRRLRRAPRRSKLPMKSSGT